MDHRNTVAELREEIADFRLRARCEKADGEAVDKVAARYVCGLAFYLADKLFFARLNHLRAKGKDTSKDTQLARLSVRLDKARAKI